MAQFETTGGGFVDSGDRRIERKVVVATGGDTLSVPSSDGGFQLSNVSVTQEPGGIRRGVFEFTQAGEGEATYNQYGKRIELTGGTREVPIKTHKKFEALEEDDFIKVDEEIEARRRGESLYFMNEDQELLISFLSRGVEYVLAPAVVGRVSEIESTLPSLEPIAKVADPSELQAPEGTFWICTAITATPIGASYEVTREYTLNFSSWEDIQALYSY
jgi:hypothetical protein